MEQKIRLMMDIIKSEICQTEFDGTAFSALPEAEQQDIAELARKHSVAQLLGDALGNNTETKELQVTKDLFLDTVKALRQTTRIENERKAICRVLEKEKIPYIQLKGARIRLFYPQPWLRSSCDNDILVREEDLDHAANALAESLDYRAEAKGFHDIPLFAKSGTPLELHFSILGRDEGMNRVLDRVWDKENVVPVSGHSEVLQSNEFFMFHIIAHLANHILGGGCGIRPLIDLYLLQKDFLYNEAKLGRLLEEAGVAELYTNVKALISVWFEDGIHTPQTQHLQNFIFSGGTYGTKKNNLAVSQKTTGKKAGEISYSILLPYEKLRFMYPVMEKHRWLMPVCQVLRWSRVIFKGRYKKFQSDIKAVRSVDIEYSNTVEQMLRENGLL